jgi:DNA polymerase III delta subunit
VAAAVKQNGGTVSVFEPIKRDELRAWITREATARNLKLPFPIVEELAMASDGSLGAILGELDKLKAFSETEKLTEQSARALMAGSETTKIWSVVDGLLSASPAEGAAALDDLLASGVSTQYLMITISGQLRDLAMAQSVLKVEGGGQSTLERELKLPGWKARRVMQQLNKVGKRDASDWLIELAELDAANKTGNASDVDGLRLFALRVAAQN